MNYKILILLFPALIFTASSCVNTNATLLSNQTYPKIHPDDVVIYLSEDDVEAEFQKIAILYAEANSNWSSPSKMLKALRKEAAKIGANGILYQSITEPSAEAKIAATLLDAEAERHAEMIAIRVFKP